MTAINNRKSVLALDNAPYQGQIVQKMSGSAILNLVIIVAVALVLVQGKYLDEVEKRVGNIVSGKAGTLSDASGSKSSLAASMTNDELEQVIRNSELNIQYAQEEAAEQRDANTPAPKAWKGPYMFHYLVAFYLFIGIITMIHNGYHRFIWNRVLVLLKIREPEEDNDLVGMNDLANPNFEPIEAELTESDPIEAELTESDPIEAELTE